MNGNGKENAYQVEVNGTTYHINFEDDGRKAVVDGQTVDLNVTLESSPSHYSLLINGDSVLLSVDEEPEPGQYRVHAAGYDYQAEVVTAREAYLRSFISGTEGGKREGRIVAPMPGLIVKLEVNEGDQIGRNQGVLVMEAMKMENEIKAPIEGQVRRIHVKTGDAVEKGQLLAEIISGSRSA